MISGDDNLVGGMRFITKSPGLFGLSLKRLLRYGPNLFLERSCDM